MSMYSKIYVLKKSSFIFIMYMQNNALWGRQRQTLNGYFLVNNGNKYNGNSRHQKKVNLRNGEERLSIDGENRFFHIKVTFSNLCHPQFSIEDIVLKLNGGNLFSNLQTILPTCFPLF